MSHDVPFDHVITCPACGGWAGAYLEQKFVPCVLCKGERVVAIRVKQLVVVEPVPEAPKESSP